MNSDIKTIIALLCEIRDLLKGSTPPIFEQSKEPMLPILTNNNRNAFFREKKSKNNTYYTIALAVYVLTKGDSKEAVERQSLVDFLNDNVEEMHARNVAQDISSTLTKYGYISSSGSKRYKINALTKKIVETLPNEEKLKDLPKRYERQRRKKKRNHERKE